MGQSWCKAIQAIAIHEAFIRVHFQLKNIRWEVKPARQHALMAYLPMLKWSILLVCERNVKLRFV